MALERTYIINLRKEWMKLPKYRRAKKAVKAVREFLARHMHQRDLEMIKIGSNLNRALWARGIRNPPHKIKINAVKEDDGTVKAELFGFKYVAVKREEKKEAEPGMIGKLKEKLGGGKEEKVKEEEGEIKAEKPKEKKEAKPEHKTEKKGTKHKKEHKTEKKEGNYEHKPSEKKPAKKEEHKHTPAHAKKK